MSHQELNQGGSRDLSQLISEKHELVHRKEESAEQLKSTTAELARLRKMKEELQSGMEMLDRRLTAMNSMKFQADCMAQYRSGSFDGDFLIDELVERINLLKERLRQVNVKLNDTSSEREQHMTLFTDIEKRLAGIAETIKDICGSSR